ncbi:glycerol kinase [Nadsonia fulvescens var. elongata DSM 6958]|uniref:glycerol kinase n=1 Tax=Nadsonia fulvescens var. elongata DSM 6958 TaxID=857566 RepID=A0A1E3PLK1_9ASCO|nr:glycerol kinase [Nadsonia fulvescens var. elongata DSM 6958]
MMTEQYIGSIDQGTTSTRFIIFTPSGHPIASHQLEFTQIYPEPSWVEHDPQELVGSVHTCMEEVAKNLRAQGIKLSQVKGIGITNQRETTIVWDTQTGAALYNAIVWSDARTATTVKQLESKEGSKEIPALCGLPISTYFAGVKVRWLIDNVPEVKECYERGHLAFSTIDSWLLYNLTGGLNGGRHITDTTNASRSMFMNIQTQKWDSKLLKFFGVEKLVLPEIVSSSEVYGRLGTGSFSGTTLSGCLGDQSAALVGQLAFEPGQAKNTYGTGCFLLYNTGEKPVISKNGLLTTVGYHFKGQKPVYALEGSIAVAGSAIKWLRDKMGLIESSQAIGTLASEVEDSAGVIFVTALSGLFAPYWRPDARGTILGLTQYTTKHHVCRAVLEATCFQTKAILDAMELDSGTPFTKLRVDGGMTNSDLAMQIQSDILGIEVERPLMRETTALGAAIAAGFAVGVYNSFEELKHINQDGKTSFKPQISSEQRNTRYALWERGVERAIGWLEN